MNYLAASGCGIKNKMKLPAASCGVSKRNSPKPTRLRSKELRRVALPFIPVASYRVFWRRRIKVLKRNRYLNQITWSHLKNRKMVRGQASGPWGLRPGGDGV